MTAIQHASRPSQRDIAYRHVKTLDALFLVQVVLTLLAAVILLSTRHLLVETVAIVMLGLTAWLSLKPR